MSPRTPLRKPLDYFGRPDRPSIAVGALYVVVDTAAGAVVVWLFLNAVIAKSAPSSTVAAEVRNAIGGAVIWTVLLAPIGWLFVGGIIHVFVWWADGENGFLDTLAIVGESHLVSLVLLPVTAAGFYLLLGQVPADPERAAEFFRRAQAGKTPLLFLSGLVGGVWRAGIQAVGLSDVHDVSGMKMGIVTFGLGFLIGLANLS